MGCGIDLYASENLLRRREVLAPAAKQACGSIGMRVSRTVQKPVKIDERRADDVG